MSDQRHAFGARYPFGRPRVRALCQLAFAATLAIDSLLVSCGGGQTGEGNGIGPSACVDEPPVSVALNEMTELGGTANDALELARAGELEGQWAGDPVSVAIELQPSADRARFVRGKPNPEFHGSALCGARLELEVEGSLRVATATETLELGMRSALVARSKYVARLDALELQQRAGALAPSLMAEETLRGYQLAAAWTAVEAGGTLWAIAEHTEYPPGWLEGNRPEPRAGAPSAAPWTVERAWAISSWPRDGACDVREVPVTLGAPIFGVDTAEAFSRAASEAALTWEDGTTTTLHLALEPNAAVACVADDCSRFCEGFGYSEAPGDRAGIGIPVRVKARTADGRWDGELATVLRAQALHQGGWAGFSIEFEATYATPAELEAALGFHGAAWPRDSRGTFRLTWELDVTTPSGTPTGSITFSAPGLPSCSACSAGPGSVTVPLGATER